MLERINCHVTAFIHELAEVNRATIGARTKIWQFASVIRGARIGDDCNISSGVIVDGAVIGDRCLIEHGAFIPPGILVCNEVLIGPQVSFTNDFWPIVDKAGWFDMADLISGGIVVTRVNNGASIGANAVVLPGVAIGVGAMVAAGAVVVVDVPAYHLFRRDGSIVEIEADRIERMRKLYCAADVAAV